MSLLFRGLLSARRIAKSEQRGFRGETHPARANLTCAPGGITLGREQGELDADLTYLAIEDAMVEGCVLMSC